MTPNQKWMPCNLPPLALTLFGSTAYTICILTSVTESTGPTGETDHIVPLRAAIMALILFLRTP